MKRQVKVPKEVKALQAKGKQFFRKTRGVKVPSLRSATARRR
jgi:hypothetical protein